MKTGLLRRILSSLLAVILTVSLTASALADDGHEQTKKVAVDFLKSAVAEKCPIASYETDDPLLSVSSYTYDSAIAALALMSEGDYDSARIILDTFAEALQRETDKEKRFRNAYMAGNAATQPGYWNNEQGAWLQDAYQVGSSTKSSSAATVALLAYHKAIPNENYLNAAVTALNWVISNCQDGKPGYTSGFTGWKSENAYTDLTYKSTSDNLWMATACRMLASATGWSKYSDAASSAVQFVTEKMYSVGDSRFFQGTAEDGETPITHLMLTDAQALAELCLGDDSGMDNIVMCRAADGGYSYDNSNTSGSWLEGSAMAALALKEIGEKEQADAVLTVMDKLQVSSGLFPQASIPELQTGEKDRVIENIPSVAPCAWYILAVNGANPLREN